MAPSILLHLLENPGNPHKQIEVCGSEPYINGGHGMAGFWVDPNRQTTIKGLYAAGDAAGGAPKKYITGCFAEAEMAVEHILDQNRGTKHFSPTTESKSRIEELTAPLSRSNGIHFTEAEQRLQKIMEEYAGGSTQNYETSRDKLLIAKKNLESLSDNSREICAGNRHELMRTQDTLDRILLGRGLVEHMLARKETRWPCYQTRLDYPARNDIEYNVFINSIWSANRPVTFKRSCLPPYAVLHNKAETYAGSY
jgi:adenylylsulfate reductase subunit A